MPARSSAVARWLLAAGQGARPRQWPKNLLVFAAPLAGDSLGRDDGPAYALVAAAALLGAAMQAPLASLALVLELTHSGFQIMVPMVAATVTATIVSRYIDGYSMYSARLPPQRGGPSRRARPLGRPEPQTDTDGLDTA